jgi:hypothetical protein
MGGRGYINEVAPIHNEHLLVLRNGRWRQMYQPVNPDRVTSGVNLSESFALSYHKEKGVDVGLIPCADGGTNIDQWCVGGLLYDHAVYMARLAMRTSTNRFITRNSPIFATAFLPYGHFILWKHASTFKTTIHFVPSNHFVVY